MRKITISELKKAASRENGFTEIQKIAIYNIVKAIEENSHPMVKSVAIDRESYLVDVAEYCTYLTLEYFDKPGYLKKPRFEESCNRSNTLIEEEFGVIPVKTIEKIWNVLTGRMDDTDRESNEDIARILYYASGRSAKEIKIVFGSEIFACLQILELISSHFTKEIGK